MFLALNEIRHSKLRYALVIGVVFLIAYLVYFLTGLAYGLAQDNRTAVDKWSATEILLADEANDNLNMSMFSQELFNEINADDKAVLAQTAGVIKVKTSNSKVNISVFGIDSKQFIAPKIIEGEIFKNDDEAVADISLKDEYKINLGDEVVVSGNNKSLKIVGFTDNARFNVSPVIYTTIGAYQDVRFGKQIATDQAKINAIVIKGDLENVPSSLKSVKISKFINELPGYSAQVLTFGFMIGFLIVIAAIVIGIFIYVLTLQKTEIFGVMKAQGISNLYIAQSVIIQTFVLSAVGVLLGLLATLGTSMVLPKAVPFQVNYLFFIGISGLMIAIAVLGALFSVSTIVRIDPLKAIG